MCSSFFHITCNSSNNNNNINSYAGQCSTKTS